MEKKKKIYLSLLLVLISTVVVIFGTSFSTASTASEFSDVNEEDWFLPDVMYVNEKGLMSGTGETAFSPYDATTRGMIAAVLWRMEGSPEEESMTFADVSENAYYRSAVAWCAGKGIVFGYSDTVFAPDDLITREQLVTMIYRYADYKGYDVTNRKELAEYSDADAVSEYAIVQFEWAIAGGIITGTGADTLSPQNTAERCQVAAILKRFLTGFADETVSAEKDKEEQTIKSEASESDGASKQTSGKLSGGSSGNMSADATEKEENIGVSYPVISIGNITAKPGDSVTVPISIKNNPGILGMILSVYFDEESLAIESIESGEAFSSLDFTGSKILESGMRLIWDGIEINAEDIKDGTILLMNVKVKENAKAGKYPVTLKYSEGDILDNDLGTVTPSVEVGYITVLKGGETN